MREANNISQSVAHMTYHTYFVWSCIVPSFVGDFTLSTHSLSVATSGAAGERRDGDGDKDKPRKNHVCMYGKENFQYNIELKKIIKIIEGARTCEVQKLLGLPQSSMRNIRKRKVQIKATEIFLWGCQCLLFVNKCQIKNYTFKGVFPYLLALNWSRRMQLVHFNKSGAAWILN